MSKWVSCENIRLLDSGEEFFPALLHAIDSAESSIYLEFYIFYHDQIGTKIFNALIRAAKRKINIEMVLDAYGCSSFPEHWKNELRHAELISFFFDRSETFLDSWSHPFAVFTEKSS